MFWVHSLLQNLSKYVGQSVVYLYPPEASSEYFGLAFATPPPPLHVERFSALTPSEENYIS